MQTSKTALILVGYQNDYFAADGILRTAIEESSTTNNVLQNTLRLVEQLKDTSVLLIQTPIIFTPTYEELNEPVGILKLVQDVGAFQQGQSGSEVISEFEPYADRILTVAGKRGLNAFSNTDLDRVLIQHGINNVVLAGAVTSVCIDSTGRAAQDRGYQVTILSDCTAGRSNFEQDFYCKNIFPLYSAVQTADGFQSQLT